MSRILLRRGTAAQWTAANPVLASGEVGVELDTSKMKIGNGLDDWSARPYANAAEIAAVTASVVKLTGAQTIADVKTFSSAPVVPAGAFPQSAVTNLVSDLAGKQATIPAGTYVDATTDFAKTAGVIAWRGVGSDNPIIVTNAGAAGMWNLQTQDATNFMFHLTAAGTGASGPTIFGIGPGGDAGEAGLGFIINLRGKGKGMVITTFPSQSIYGAAIDYALLWQQNSTHAPFLYASQGVAGARPLISFVANAAQPGQQLVVWSSFGATAGYVDADGGKLNWHKDIQVMTGNKLIARQREAETMRTTGATVTFTNGSTAFSGADLALTAADVGQRISANVPGMPTGVTIATQAGTSGTLSAAFTGATITTAIATISAAAFNTDSQSVLQAPNSGALLTEAMWSGHRYSGTTGLFYCSRLRTANNVGVLQCSTGASAIGSETMITALTFGANGSSQPRLGFFGVTTPIVQPTGTAAASTDLASVVTLANDLRTKLLALGLVA